ncbi:hypothetical protein [Microlunatus parietis]|uniref:Uncharacterized protein n=1 Tax=Microlunatus parietis TaxID=682979 RepID=A0A7Y9IDB6_9ACTN|nr:hypothetical protein [Microlunatus parietis]NYE74720.1 hypothetical protein [Microlunatus parietis]
MKRVLIIVGGCVVIAGCLAGILAVTLGLIGWTPPLVNQPPWSAGKPLAPVPVGDDPKLISYATAGLIRDRLATAPSLEDAQFEVNYAFDDDARIFGREGRQPPAGRIAQVSAFQSDAVPGAEDRANVSVAVELFSGTDERDAALLRYGQSTRGSSTVLEEPNVDGAAGAQLIQRVGACSSGRGRNVSIHGLAAVGSRTAVTVSVSCGSPEQAEQYVEPATDTLAEAVGTATGLEDEPIPVTLFDRAAAIPVISSGNWRDRQVVVDSEERQRAVPADLRGDGLEVYFDGRYEVAAYRDAEAAAAVLERRLATKGEHRREVREHPGTAADRTVCLEGFRPREKSDCLSRLGRFVVVASADQGKDPEIDDQLDLLRGVR